MGYGVWGMGWNYLFWNKYITYKYSLCYFRTITILYSICNWKRQAGVSQHLCEPIKEWHLPRTDKISSQERDGWGCPWTHRGIIKLLIKQNLYCSAVTATPSPTLYAVLQEFGARLLSLLSKSNQSQRFIEWQLAQGSICGVNLLSNLRRTKTIWREGWRFFQSEI